MNQYLFVLGRNFELSRAELRNFCEEVFVDPRKSLFIGENLRFENPRNIPREEHQLFLDRLGGTIRFGKILGEFASKSQLMNMVWDRIEEEQKFKVGFSSFGAGKDFQSELIGKTKDHFEKIRIENYQGKNLNSGQIFDRRILQKGHEFLIWKNENSFLLAETIANQNLRNYTLRDRNKVFRDPKMGMLPPKLAQILINLANPNIDQTIIDPFCGSGTINIEAAILGHKTIGSDWNEMFVKSSQKNFSQMAEKFRYEEKNGEFFPKDATQFDHPEMLKTDPVIVTEGYLGKNFERQPEKADIQKNAREVLALWKKFFKNIDNTNIQTCSFCLPAWNHRGQKTSISQDLFDTIKSYGFKPEKIFNDETTFFYEREDTFVAREVCLVKR